jgi:Spy/CpxP family protein refolding chaperone
MDHELMPPMLPIPDLSPEQQELIRKSGLKQMEAITPLKNQIREKTARLNSILAIQPVNIKEANQIADEMGQIHASILKVHISHDLDLRNILTADQKVIFDAKPKPFLRKGGR